ncbi:MAG: hypothetical protein WBM59_03460 [Sedimenticolaceae bacterium]
MCDQDATRREGSLQILPGLLSYIAPDPDRDEPLPPGTFGIALMGLAGMLRRYLR